MEGSSITKDLEIGDEKSQAPVQLKSTPAKPKSTSRRKHEFKMIVISLPQLSKHLKQKIKPVIEQSIEEKNQDQNSADLKLPLQFNDQYQVFFGCVAPLRSDHIDITLEKTSEIELKYNCGVYMPVDSSVLVDSLLSIEFLTGLEKQAKKYSDNKRITLFIHGGSFNMDDKKSAAEHVLNECILFYDDMPFLTVPFIWPCRDRLFGLDNRKKAIEKMANYFVEFTRRVWTRFNQMDFVAHGRGCQILMKSLEILSQDDTRNLIRHSSIIFIAPDVEAPQFRKYVRLIKPYVHHMTLYINTNDITLIASRLLNWSKNRAGSAYIIQNEIDTIDTTKLLTDWKSTNHYYLTDSVIKYDIIQALNGIPPNLRTYTSPLTHTNGKVYYELNKA